MSLYEVLSASGSPKPWANLVANSLSLPGISFSSGGDIKSGSISAISGTFSVIDVSTKLSCGGKAQFDSQCLFEAYASGNMVVNSTPSSIILVGTDVLNGYIQISPTSNFTVVFPTGADLKSQFTQFSESAMLNKVFELKMFKLGGGGFTGNFNAQTGMTFFGTTAIFPALNFLYADILFRYTGSNTWIIYITQSLS